MKIIGKAICIAASIMMASPVPSYAATAKKSAKATTGKVAKKATKKTAIKTVKKGLNYKATITAGETLTLKLTGLKGYYVDWGTTNPHIVTVNDGDRNYASIGKKGVVKGVKAGTAKIFAVAGKKSAGKIYYECTFTVKEGKKKPVKPKPTKYSLFTPEQKAAYWAAEKADKDAIIKASADPTSEETCDSMEYMEDVWLSDNTKIVTKNTPGIPKFCKMQMVAGKQYIDITNASKENSIKIIDGHKNENGIYERYAYIYIHFNGHIYRMMNYRDRRDPSVKYIWDANNWNPGAHIKQYVKINKVIY